MKLIFGAIFLMNFASCDHSKFKNGTKNISEIDESLMLSDFGSFVNYKNLSVSCEKSMEIYRQSLKAMELWAIESKNLMKYFQDF